MRGVIIVPLGIMRLSWMHGLVVMCFCGSYCFNRFGEAGVRIDTVESFHAMGGGDREGKEKTCFLGARQSWIRLSKGCRGLEASLARRRADCEFWAERFATH